MNNKLYDEEYKLELLALIEGGQNVGDIAWEYGLPVKTIRRWMDERRRGSKNTFSGKKHIKPNYQERYDLHRTEDW